MNATQIEYVTKSAGQSQCERILAVLAEHEGEWVDMPALALAATDTGLGTAVHSRTAELNARFEQRNIAYKIEQHSTWHGRRCHSKYRLVKLALVPAL